MLLVLLLKCVLVIFELRLSLSGLLQRLICLQTRLWVLLLEVMVLMLLRLSLLLRLLLYHLVGATTIIAIGPAHSVVRLLLLVILQLETSMLLMYVLLVVNNYHSGLA